MAMAMATATAKALTTQINHYSVCECIRFTTLHTHTFFLSLFIYCCILCCWLPTDSFASCHWLLWLLCLLTAILPLSIIMFPKILHRNFVLYHNISTELVCMHIHTHTHTRHEHEHTYSKVQIERERCWYNDEYFVPSVSSSATSTVPRVRMDLWLGFINLIWQPSLHLEIFTSLHK